KIVALLLDLVSCECLPRRVAPYQRTLLGTISNVFGLIVDFAGLPQRPDNAQPPISQCPIGAGPAVSARQLVMEVAAGPATVLDTLAGKVVDSPAQRMGASKAKLNYPLLAALTSERHGPGNGLQASRRWEALWIIAQPGQEPSRS